MGINDLFDGPINPQRIDGSSEPFVPLKKDLEYRRKIQELEKRNVDLSVERHKIFMDNIAFYRQYHCYPEKVNIALSKISEREEINTKMLNKTRAQYHAYCKQQNNR